MNSILLTLGMPPSDNGLYANVTGRGRIKSDRYRTWRRDADNRYLTQKRFVRPIAGHFVVTVTLDEGSRLTATGAVRKRDVSNRGKAILDALASWGLTADDAYCDELTLRWGKTRRGECIVEVYPSSRQPLAAEAA